MSSIHDEPEEVPVRSPSPPPPFPTTNAEIYALYKAKWNTFKSGQASQLTFTQLPWPVLFDAAGPGDITGPRLSEFYAHPERPVSMHKNKKELGRAELLLWHPDKFMGKVIGKAHNEELSKIQEGVGAVTRFLIELAAE
ncbi:hypothetical protein GALMADRAFT_73675 [Galerina marginata CBS 339.88]|uniref:Uncharacterized protein n=1 Tax=Galerina marginata (strain CBS 339.88) TaxID=685588 RepID=A0A067T0U4_GALM3|nr:hypothetical protein GALMADRAFT_73675 [Galerina marginata CBS 339.88]